MAITQNINSHANAAKGTGPAPRQSDFTVRTEMGIDGYVTAVCPFTVNLHITNVKEDFAGTVRVIPGHSDYYYNSKKVAYGQDITLSKGEEKSFQVSAPAIAVSGSDALFIEITDEAGKRAYYEKLKVEYEDAGTFLMLGILSDDFSALNYFDGCDVSLATYSARVKILELDEQSMPENSAALKVCQMILINDYDTAKLSDMQYQALKEWVADGGVLIIGTGATYQTVFNKFTDEFISGTVGNLSQTSLTVGAETEPLSEVDSLEFEFDGADVLPGISISDQNQEYVKEIGFGRVVVLKYNPGMAPVGDWSRRVDLAEALVSQSVGNQTETWMTAQSPLDFERFSVSSGHTLASLMDNPKKPSPLLYGLLFSLYVVVVGPVLYLFLKKLNKREKLWMMICFTALGATVLIYITGLFYRVREPIVNNFAVIRLDGDTKKEEVFTEIIVPKSQRYQMELNKDYRNFMELTDRYDYYSYSYYDEEELTDSYDYTIKNNETIRLDINRMASFDTLPFSTQRLTDNDLGKLDMEIEFHAKGFFTGTITNNTEVDLKEVTLVFENYMYIAGDIEKGGTHFIDQSKIADLYQDNYYLDSYYQFYYMNRLRTDAERERYRLYNIQNSMKTAYQGDEYLPEYTYNQGAVWGMVADYNVNVISSPSVKQNSGALILQQFAADYADVEGNYYPDIDAMRITDITDQDKWGYYGAKWFEGEVIMEYSFNGYNPITALELSGTDSSAESIMAYAEVSAYNVETAQYEQIFVNTNQLGKAELDKYLADGILRLKYSPPSGMSGASIPRIMALWEVE